MNRTTTDALLRMTYEAAYDYLKAHPEFAGRPRPGHPGLLRRGVDPSVIEPWPGVGDVRRMSRDDWVAARIDAVNRGEEESPLRATRGDRR